MDADGEQFRARRGGASNSERETDADAELIALGRAFDAATVRDREANDALAEAAAAVRQAFRA